MDKQKASNIINNRIVTVLLHGSSIYELEKRIEELKKANLGNEDNLHELEWLKTQAQIAT